MISGAASNELFDEDERETLRDIATCLRTFIYGCSAIIVPVVSITAYSIWQTWGL